MTAHPSCLAKVLKRPAAVAVDDQASEVVDPAPESRRWINAQDGFDIAVKLHHYPTIIVHKSGDRRIGLLARRCERLGKRVCVWVRVGERHCINHDASSDDDTVLISHGHANHLKGLTPLPIRSD